MTSNKLPRQDSDPIWTKPCVPQAASCLPTPIPPRNEPSISIYITPIGDDIDSLTGTPGSTSRSLPQTLQLAEVDVPTSVTPESGLQLVGLSRQDTFLASDPIWTKSPIGDGIDSLTPCSTPRSLQQTLQLPEVDKVDIQIMLDVPTSVIPKSRLQLVGLSRQDTFPASDPIWTKSPCVPGIPTPIPPRNEPSISTYIMSESVVDDIDSSLSQTLQPTESESFHWPETMLND